MQAIGQIVSPTQSDLAAMGNLDLQKNLLDFSQQLDGRLSQLSTGAGWQRHLGLPEEGLGTDVTARHRLGELLSRFDRVLENPQYGKISNLSSFEATHVTLRELVSRLESDEQSDPPKNSTALVGLEGPQIIEPTTGKTASLQKKSSTQQEQLSRETETLPTPAAVAKPDPPRGERSILRRK